MLGSRERGAVTPTAPTPPSTARDAGDDAAAPSDHGAMTERRLRAAGGVRDVEPGRPAAAVLRRPRSRAPPTGRRRRDPAAPAAAGHCGLRRRRGSFRTAAEPRPGTGRPTGRASDPIAAVVRSSARPLRLRHAASAVSSHDGHGRWTVYANPTRDLLAAEHERAALRAKGYAADVVTLRRDGDLWYRIRVGRYATEAQAEDAARRLRSDGSAHGFVQSE